MVIFGGSISIIAIALLPATDGFWLLLIAYLAATFGQACEVPAANTYIIQEGRTYGMGVSVTLFMMALHIGTGLGPIALGAIADRFGLTSAFYGISASMAVGLLLFALLVRRTPVARL